MCGGLPGVRLGLKCKEREWIPGAQDPVQVLSEAGRQIEDLGKERRSWGTSWMQLEGPHNPQPL